MEGFPDQRLALGQLLLKRPHLRFQLGVLLQAETTEQYQ